MRESIVIDAHVHVGRNHSRWAAVYAQLEAVGIDTAVVSPDPDSFDLRGERSIGRDLARPGGPYGLWYVGGEPFAGYRLSRPLLPPDLGDYDGLDWHCFFSEGYDFGGSSGAELDAAEAWLESGEAKGALEVLEAAREARLPVRLTESFPLTVCLVTRFPEIVFVIPHLGLRSGGISRVLNALADRPNVHFDTSLVEPNEGMVKRAGAHRVLLGSDAPGGDPARALRDVRNLSLPLEDLASILGENARRLFERKGRA